MFSLTSFLSMRTAGVAAALLLTGLSIPMRAADIHFNTDPFAGTTVLTTPGRQFVGNELFLDTFNVGTDRFTFNLSVFGLNSLNFFSGFGADLPSSGVNMISLLDAPTPFNAGLAANLIAEQTETDGAGFFMYFNSNLNLNRLVYSANLNDNTADLKILARIVSPSGQGAIDALPTFAEANFVATPEPTTAFMVLGASALLLAMKKFARR